MSENKKFSLTIIVKFWTLKVYIFLAGRAGKCDQVKQQSPQLPVDEDKIKWWKIGAGINGLGGGV
jgi:hypothetical protein